MSTVPTNDETPVPVSEARWSSRRVGGLLFGILLVALAIRLPFYVRDVYHSDEYRTLDRSLSILSGDFFLDDEPSQKPPFFYMLLASVFGLGGVSEEVALLPGFLASLALIVVTFLLARQLYGDAVTSLSAAALAALSPALILYSPTVFLDLPMLFLGLLGCLAASYGRAVWSGLLIGLAFGTKQGGVLFATFALPCLLISLGDREARRVAAAVGAWAAGFFVTGGLAILWSLANETLRLHFIVGQIENERQVTQTLAVVPWRDGVGALVDRLLGWREAGRVLLPDEWIAWLGVVGLAFLVVRHVSLRRSGAAVERAFAWDLLLLAWSVGFVLFHVFVRFRFVDRYFLPLVPFVAIAVGRTLTALLAWASRAGGVWRSGFVFALVALIAVGSVLRLVDLEQAGTLPSGRRVGLLYDVRPDFKFVLGRLEQSTSEGDLVVCQDFICPGVRFWLWPRRDVVSTREMDPALLRAPGRRRFVVWPRVVPLESLTSILDGHAGIVPRSSPAGQVVVFEVIDL